MALFSRRSKGAPESRSLPKPDPSHWIGRKFRTDRSTEESVEIFMSVKDECYEVDSKEGVEWAVSTGAATFRSTQGNPTVVPPALLISYELVRGGRITLALWDGMVSYGDGTGVGGPPREMWFVPSGFDTSSPIAIAGRWKMRDPSLSSIGWVESPLWGAFQAN
jgi:hypothetical protein